MEEPMRVCTSKRHKPRQFAFSARPHAASEAPTTRQMPFGVFLLGPCHRCPDSRGKAGACVRRAVLPETVDASGIPCTWICAAALPSSRKTKARGKTKLPIARRRDGYRGWEGSAAAVYRSPCPPFCTPQVAARCTATCFTTKAARCSLNPSARPMSLYGRPCARI